MKKIKLDAYLKGILLLVIGIFIIFLPSLLSGLFYFLGAALIIYSIITMAIGISKGRYSTSIPKAVIEIIIGFAIIVLPKFLKIGIPIIIGFFFLLSGVNRIFNAIENRQNNPRIWVSSAISALLLIVCGLFFITNPAHVSGTFITIVGAVFIIGGLSVIALQYLRSKAPSDDNSVIDINDFSVKDNDK